jgi:Spy/CpxP family protein refolding chaperone
MRLVKSIAGGAALCALIAVATPATTPSLAQTQGAAGEGAGNNNPMSMGINFDKAGPDEETRQKRREIEEAYQKTTKTQPAAQTAVNDPWANMRGNEPPKTVQPAPKTAQKKKPAQ